MYKFCKNLFALFPKLKLIIEEITARSKTNILKQVLFTYFNL